MDLRRRFVQNIQITAFFIDLLCNMPKIKNPEIIFNFLLTNGSACVIIDTEREQRGKQND
jgi:hypothetical protein